MKNMMLDDAIIKMFKDNGMPLEYFAPESDEGMPLWQYDGYSEGSNVTVQLFVGVNRLNKVGVFGEYYANSNNSFSLSVSMDEWLLEYGKYLGQIKRGEDLKF